MKKLNTFKDFINPKETIVMVVDVQNDYCSKKGIIATKRKFDMTAIYKMVDKLIPFVEKMRKKGYPILFARMIEDTKYMTESAVNHRGGDEHPLELCTPGTPGFEYFKIKPKKGDKEIVKPTYDAFFDGTLESYLKGKGIKNIIMTGCYTAVCVDSTLRHAFSSNFNIVVPEDLVSMPKQRMHHHDVALEIWDMMFAFVTTSEEILKAVKITS